jgi:hypothetical protein
VRSGGGRLCKYQMALIRRVHAPLIFHPFDNVDFTQNFIQFDCLSAKDELEKRFSHFTNQLLPTVLKSAVQSANTVVFVPSSLDFTRIQNHFRKLQLSFAVLSE